MIAFDPAPPDMPIPNRLNVALVVGVVASAVGLLWLGSWVEQWYAVLGVGVVFSYLLLTNYALLHEATHNNLHSHPRVNAILGTATGIFFPVPFSLVHSTHQGHHLRNRTDFEMFDLYYPTDRRWLRFVQWYSILCGLFWLLAPLGALAFALHPPLLRLRPIQTARSSSYLIGDIRGTEVRAIRFEVVLIVLVFAGLFWLLELRWQNTLILYACFAFNWSTRQYVGHAFTRRDVIEGAWNLRHNLLMSLILLHGEYDLNHHRRPDVSWYYLPRLVQQSDPPRRSYVVQYLRLWLGPRLTTEPGPESLRAMPLSIHD
jgi:fatty acid desaturase